MAELREAIEHVAPGSSFKSWVPPLGEIRKRWEYVVKINPRNPAWQGLTLLLAEDDDTVYSITWNGALPLQTPKLSELVARYGTYREGPANTSPGSWAAFFKPVRPKGAKYVVEVAAGVDSGGAAGQPVKWLRILAKLPEHAP